MKVAGLLHLCGASLHVASAVLVPKCPALGLYGSRDQITRVGLLKSFEVNYLDEVRGAGCQADLVYGKGAFTVEVSNALLEPLKGGMVLARYGELIQSSQCHMLPQQQQQQQPGGTIANKLRRLRLSHTVICNLGNDSLVAFFGASLNRNGVPVKLYSPVPLVKVQDRTAHPTHNKSNEEATADDQLMARARGDSSGTLSLYAGSKGGPVSHDIHLVNTYDVTFVDQAMVDIVGTFYDFSGEVNLFKWAGAGDTPQASQFLKSHPTASTSMLELRIPLARLCAQRGHDHVCFRAPPSSISFGGNSVADDIERAGQVFGIDGLHLDNVVVYLRRGTGSELRLGSVRDSTGEVKPAITIPLMRARNLLGSERCTACSGGCESVDRSLWADSQCRVLSRNSSSLVDILGSARLALKCAG
ncbi:hypothetical protein FOL46_005960 [Perkinsus olseni]|nr:hypothetical protein FOL46_005960 [Perkinsus olseni]